MKKIDCVEMLLLVIGGINWVLVGVFNFNLVDYIFGRIWIDRVLFFLIGVSGVYVALAWKSVCARQGGKRG